MVKYKIVFSKAADRDKKLLKGAGLDKKAIAILNILSIDPFQSPPSFEKLTGDLDGMYSRRINRKHRIVYEVLKEENTVKILRMWTHYEM